MRLQIHDSQRRARYGSRHRFCFPAAHWESAIKTRPRAHKGRAWRPTIDGRIAAEGAGMLRYEHTCVPSARSTRLEADRAVGFVTHGGSELSTPRQYVDPHFHLARIWGASRSRARRTRGGGQWRSPPSAISGYSSEGYLVGFASEGQGSNATIFMRLSAPRAHAWRCADGAGCVYRRQKPELAKCALSRPWRRGGNL